MYIYIYIYIYIYMNLYVYTCTFKFEFTPCKAEQPLQDIELQQKEKVKDQKHAAKLIRKNPKTRGAYELWT